MFRLQQNCASFMSKISFKRKIRASVVVIISKVTINGTIYNM